MSPGFWYPARVAGKLPEEFAPTGPKLTRFVLRPPPPVKPRLFPDEARFAARLALMAGGAEVAAWAWIARTHGLPALGLAGLRLLRPLWAWAGTRAPRPLVAFALLAVALLTQGAAIFTLGTLAVTAALAAGLPAIEALASTTIADSVTVERRASAYAWLDMGQGLGTALGLALGAAAPHLVPVGAAAALFLAGLGVPDLHDRGTPRSSWPLRTYAEVARTPLASQLILLAAGIGALCAAALPGFAADLLAGAAGPAPGTLALSAAAVAVPAQHAAALSHRAASSLATLRAGFPWLVAALPLAGMAVAARLEERARNAVLLPRGLLALAALSFALRAHGGDLLSLFVLGGAAAALPAAVARGAGEMDRPLASSLAWMALALGAGAGACVAALL